MSSTSYETTNFLQTETWAETNRLIGHHVLCEPLDDSRKLVMIIKNAKRGRYMEIPAGPILNWQDDSELQRVYTLITQLAKREHCAFIRLRPQLLNSTKNLQVLQQAFHAQPAPMHLAAEHTVIIDLAPSEEQLLANMRRQTRYEVRRALKLNLQVTHSNSAALFEEFHRVQAQTAARQSFIPPDLKTLNAERQAFGDHAQIYVAKTSDGAPVAYGLILRDTHNLEADYYEAASTELNRKLPGAYALQWQVIRDLKQLGIQRYNLWGIAPPHQPQHRYAGVTTFKTGFGGEVVTYVPAHDIILSKLKYAPDYFIETLRKKRRHL